jgi:hypothetical protein
MFFPSLGINEMVGSVPLLETIPDERAKHAMLLVDAVEKRTNMTILAESTPSKLRGLRGGLHILTFTQKERSSPAGRLVLPDSILHVTQVQPGALANGTQCTSSRPALST